MIPIRRRKSGPIVHQRFGAAEKTGQKAECVEKQLESTEIAQMTLNDLHLYSSIYVTGFSEIFIDFETFCYQQLSIEKNLCLHDNS